jgi:hypothetical protein
MPVLYDLLSMRRVHRVAMFSVPFIWILHQAEIPLGRTAAWHFIANLMLKHLS